MWHRTRLRIRNQQFLKKNEASSEAIAPNDYAALDNPITEKLTPINRRQVEESITTIDPAILFADIVGVTDIEVKSKPILEVVQRVKNPAQETRNGEIRLTEPYGIISTDKEKQTNEPDTQIFEVSFSGAPAILSRHTAETITIEESASVRRIPKELIPTEIAASVSLAIEESTLPVIELARPAGSIEMEAVIYEAPKFGASNKDMDTFSVIQELTYFTELDEIGVIKVAHDLTGIAGESIQPKLDIYSLPKYDSQPDPQVDVPVEPMMAEVEAYDKIIPEATLQNNLRRQLVVALQEIEPEQAETVQSILTIITHMAKALDELPDSEEESREIMEQALEEWCVCFISSLNIEPSTEVVNIIVNLIMSNELVETIKLEDYDIEVLDNEGTHEYKYAVSLATFTNLIHSLRQKVCLPVWLGKYALQIIAT
jgi:predicted DNA-binding protein (UPF0251 family)